MIISAEGDHSDDAQEIVDSAAAGCSIVLGEFTMRTGFVAGPEGIEVKGVRVRLILEMEPI
jgi:hypothetical protein